MEISKVIKERIKAKNKRFHCNDNISEFIQDGELDQLQQEVEGKFWKNHNMVLTREDFVLFQR